MQLGHRIKQDKASKIVRAVADSLGSDTPRFICSINSFKPLVDKLIVTNTRLVAVMASEGAIKWDVCGSDVRDIETNTTWDRVIFWMSDGSKMKFGSVHREDQEQIVKFLDEMATDSPESTSFTEPGHVAVTDSTDTRTNSERPHTHDAVDGPDRDTESKDAKRDARAEEKLRVRQAKREQAEKDRQARAAKEAQRKEDAQAHERKLQEMAGRCILTETFSDKRIDIFQNGFVRVNGVFIAGKHEKLIAITADRAVQEKSSGGRALAAMATAGVSTLYSSENLKTFLTIVTDGQTHSLQSQGASSYKAAQALASAGTAVVQSAQASQATAITSEPRPGVQPTSHSSLTEQLREIASLHKDGILSDEEFQAAKGKLLGAG